MQLSAADALVLMLAGVAIWALWIPMRELALILGFVIGHFFLFCNVFRIHRKYELAWAAIFIMNVAFGVLVEAWNLAAAMLGQVPITLAFIVAEMRSTRYHGVGCRIVNARQVAEWTKRSDPVLEDGRTSGAPQRDR